MSRYRDPQLQVGENSSYFFNLKPHIYKSRYSTIHIIPNNNDLHRLIKQILTLTGGVYTMRRISGSANTTLRCTTCIHVACMLYSKWAGNAIDWESAGLMVVCHVGRLYTYLRHWKFRTIVWENTNDVHFRAVWKNTAHVQGIRCSPKGSHLIPWTSAVFSNTARKWIPFAYLKSPHGSFVSR